MLIISHVRSKDASQFFCFQFTKHAVFTLRSHHLGREFGNFKVVPLRAIAASGSVTITHSAPVPCHG